MRSDTNYQLRVAEEGELENEKQWIKTCWVCDKENAVKDMVYSYDRYICNTKDCLHRSFETVAEELEMTKGSLQACR